MAQYSAHLAGNLARPYGAPERFQLDVAETANVKVLGARLRALHVLPKGQSIRSAVQQGHDWFVYPRGGQPIKLKRTDLWTHIGRGKAGWHATRPDGTSSSGGTLESMSGTTTSQWDGAEGRPWYRAGYLAEAAEGAHVWDAGAVDDAAFTRFVISGPMLSAALAEDAVDAFGQKDAEAARRMLPGLSGGFDVLAGIAIAEQEAGKKLGSFDRVGWRIYRGLLEQLGGVRFGQVHNGAVVWEAAP